MNCERCGARPGVVRYTEYVEGQARKQMICVECAQGLGFGSSPSPAAEEPLPKAQILGLPDVAAQLAAAAEEGGEGERRCPGCGLTTSDFRQIALFGCPTCYETFDEDLDLLLKRLHGAVTHRGRLPHGRAPKEAEASALRHELEEALRTRDYDRAARLRDRLRQIERDAEGGRSPESGT